MELVISKAELYTLIKKAVKDVLQEESFLILLKNISPVSKEEMKEIKKTYGKPSKRKRSVLTETIEI